MWRIALVSGSPLVLAGLRAGFDALGAFDIVLESPSMNEAQQALYGHADVAVVDGEAPALLHNGDDREGPALVLLADDADHELADWLTSGITVLPRRASIEAIAAAAQATATGLVATSPQLAARALRLARYGDRAAAPPALERLTAREHEVLDKMSQGLGNREIADALHISPHTAKFHVAQIISKLDASSRAHAVAKAFRCGLFPLPLGE